MNLINLSGEGEIEINEESLIGFWDNIVPGQTGVNSDNARYIFIEGFKNLASEKENELLYLKTKGWKVSLKKNVAKNLVLTPAIGGILYYLGITSIPGILVTTILPILFDADNIELSRKEEEILLRLPVKAGNQEYKTADDWYNSLPKHIKSQVNQLDFYDFIDKLVLAGYAKEGKNHQYLIYTKGKNKFRITLS